MQMLKFCKTAFHNFFEIILWINVIACAFIGFRSGMVIDGFIGMILGVVVDMLFNIIGGGLIATFLNIDKNIENMDRNIENMDKNFVELVNTTEDKTNKTVGTMKQTNTIRSNKNDEIDLSELS